MKRSTWLKLIAVAMIACVTTAFAADPAPIKGNPDSKIYHKVGCRFYNAKGCTKEFKTEAEAIKAGYKPCKQCAVPKNENKAAKPEKPAAQPAGSAEKSK